MGSFSPCVRLAAGCVLLAAGCHGGPASAPDAGDGGPTAADGSAADRAAPDAVSRDVVTDEASRPPPGDAHYTLYSQMPGTVCFGAGGKQTVVPGGSTAAPSLAWLALPDGFCAHYFGHVPTARQLRVAPGGELFVASPSTGTSGGAPRGLGAIVVLYDDDGDGLADGDALAHTDGTSQALTTFTAVASTQGLLFAPGAFYFQDATRIMKVPYAPGQRAIAGTPSQVVDITVYRSTVHWPKTLDRADDGTIYVGNGGDQAETCNAGVFPRPFHGGILAIDGTPGGTPVAQGFRNPIAVRCQRGHDLCFATELALDGSNGLGGREKIVPIRAGDDWGFPCCATTGVPYKFLAGTPDCSQVASEDVALEVGDTPFGLDFEPGLWPAPFTKNLLVTLHGQAGSPFVGERVVAVPTGPDGMPVKTTDIGTSNVTTFINGWGGTLGMHGRPAAVTFGADGRAYIADDFNGDIFWVAPVDLKTP